jgi:outer membrane lipopolysaccharide assembly protein LptE/RlpB
MRKVHFLVYVFVLLVTLVLGGCGGGFRGDSEGANDLGETIFGPDSLM